MKILLVGASEATRSVAQRAFAARRHETECAATGEDGIASVGVFTPPLIVVEEGLSDMKAAEFCRRVRSRVDGAHAVILVITHDDGELPAVLDAGATDLFVNSYGEPALESRLLIAERLVAQHERLRDREARFRRLFEAGLTGVTITDLDGDFREANDAFLRMLGYTHEEMLAGKLNWTALTPTDLRGPDREARDQLRATGFMPLREREFLHKDGHRVAVLAGASLFDRTTEQITYVTDISERKLAEQALRASEARYRRILDTTSEGVWIIDARSTTTFVNSRAAQQVGCEVDELVGKPASDFMDARVFASANEPPVDQSSRFVARHDVAITRRDGTTVQLLFAATAMFDDEGRREGTLAMIMDVTDRWNTEEALRKSEEQLRQAQKMEAIGRLAGGIAHDFNNLLTVILSYSAMVVAGMGPADPLRLDVDEISAAGRRAADLTRQLLMFSRQEVVEPKVLDLNVVITSMDTMLQRIVGEDIDIVTIPGFSLQRVRADHSHIEQVIMNLVVNSRDAMPTGGKLTIETANVVLDEEYARGHLGVTAGPHVMLAVSDTGIGMDAVTQERIFEPFFTTKELGKGTGLGLSTVFGIVQQSGGSIWVYSEVGRGTTVKVYLPRTNEAATVERAPTPGVTLRGTETILLVEDDDRVRTVAMGILRRSGYHVFEARSANEALGLCESQSDDIDLLISDVVMPRMSGPELAKHLALARPHMRVLCMSGYTDDAVVRHGALDAGIAFLQKPFTPDTLTHKVRAVLDAV